MMAEFKDGEYNEFHAYMDNAPVSKYKEVIPDSPVSASF
jgi:hypothetical protein